MSNVLHTARNIKPIKVALASGGTPSPERQAFNAAFALARAKYLAGQGPSTFPYKGALYGVDVANKPMLQGRVGQPANVPVPQARPDDLGQSFAAPTEDHAAPMQQPNNWGASGFGGDKDVSPAPQSPITAQPATGSMADYANAIKQIESSGRYHIMGPATKSGDRAYGAYQVMGENIPSWTKAATGQSLTPQQFLASPEAQDAVFQYHFGNAVKKYGSPEDAASVWFSGRPMASAGNAADITGTTVPQYVQNFRNALGRVQRQPDVNTPAAVHAGPQFTTNNQTPANVPLPPVRPASFDQSPPLASGVPSAPAPGTRGLSFAPAEDDQTLANNWAQMHTQVGANVPAEDYEAPSFGEGITPSSYEVKPNADEAAMKAMEDDLAAHKQGMGADSLWEANKDSYADGGEVYRNVNPLGLYSEGADIASQAKQPEQTPQQWQQYLSTRVKPDEMRWSGVGDMLASGSGKLHKDDVAEAFDHSNMNDYQENVYRGMNSPHARYQLAGPKENYREVVLQHKPEEEKFAARGHYSDSNPLLHIRMSDRPHPEGGKILHVEELQSDWGQKGRQKGFKDQSLQKEYEDAVEKWKKADDIHFPIYEKETEQFDHIPWQDPSFLSLIEPYEEKYNLAMEPFINAKIAAEEKLKTQKNKISPAPHVEDTNKWVDLGLKRILAEAAKGDYRGISFTSGGSQAARWNNEEGLVKPYDETIPSRMQKLMNQHDSSNQFQKYAIPFTEEDKFFSHYIPMSDKAADSIQKGQKRFKRGGYIPHHNPIVEQALNKTSIAPLDVMSLVKRSRGRP